MKIVHLCNYYQPQMTYQESSLAYAHRDLGHQVSVVTSDRYFPFPEYETTVQKILGERYVGTGVFDDKGVTVYRLPVRVEKSARVWLKDLEKVLLDIQPDFILCHGLFNFSAFRLLWVSKRLNARIVFDEHIIPSVVRTGLMSKMIYFLYRLFLTKKIERVAERIVGISDGCMPVLKQYLGFNTDKLKMIPLGTDVTVFKPDASKRAQKRLELGILDNQIVVLYTGKIYLGKNAELIIQAIDELNRPDLNIVSVFVGSVAIPFQETWGNIVSKAQHKVHHIKMVDTKELVSFFNAADIAAWPGLPTISTIEASACGCPIICSDDLTERFQNNSGFGVPEGNYESFKKALYTMLLDENLRLKMSQNARELAEQIFDWRIIAEKFIA